MRRPPLIAGLSWAAIIAGFALIALYALGAAVPSASLINAVAGFFLVLGGVVIRLGGAVGRWGVYVLLTVLVVYAIVSGAAALDSSDLLRWVLVGGAAALLVFAVLLVRFSRSEQAKVFFLQ